MNYQETLKGFDELTEATNKDYMNPKRLQLTKLIEGTKNLKDFFLLRRYKRIANYEYLLKKAKASMSRDVATEDYGWAETQWYPIQEKLNKMGIIITEVTTQEDLWSHKPSILIKAEQGEMKMEGILTVNGRRGMSEMLFSRPRTSLRLSRCDGTYRRKIDIGIFVIGKKVIVHNNILTNTVKPVF